MTKTDLNSARRKSRPLIAAFLTDYAHQIGFETVCPTAPARRAAGKVAGVSQPPEPDLIWLREGRQVAQFHILPQRVMTRRLPEISHIGEMIVCIDSAGKTGIIEPRKLLQFLNQQSGTHTAKLGALLNELPEAPRVAPEAQFVGTVADNQEIAPDHFSLKIMTELAQRPAPGQFLQILCDPAPHETSPQYRSVTYAEKSFPRLRGMELIERRPFLRRPFSIASYIGGGEIDGAEPEASFLRLVSWLEHEFEIIFRRIPGGPGTGALARFRSGDKIDVVGPLGKGFSIDPVPQVALLIGGGIGAPPLHFLAEELTRKGSEVRIFLGAVTKSRIPFQISELDGFKIERFEKMGIHPVVSTDDGSLGLHGLVTEPLISHLERRQTQPGSMKMFACGPRALLSALNGIADRFRIPCEALLEERMACGIGACISCVCPVKEPGQKVHFTRICVEGPAFNVQKVMWHA